MAKGIIYVMTTVVPGLVKIGKTGCDHFETRMHHLERNGYFNVVGLKRAFAIEVEDYDEKEVLIDEIFSKSRVPNSELFALDADLVIQLLSSLDGRQVYPESVSKEEIFSAVTEERKAKVDCLKIPNGIYYLTQNIRGFKKVTATAQVENGIFTVQKGSICAPIGEQVGWIPEERKRAIIENDTLCQDVQTNAPSVAGWIVLGHSNNGWMVWKDAQGNPIDIYRKTN